MDTYIISGSKEFQQQKTTELCAVWGVKPFDIVRCEAGEERVGIAEVRAFQKNMMLAPLSSSVRVGIIADTETLTVEAQNAMLKILEEPPPHARIICQTTARNMLLPTIISRCVEISQNSNTNLPDARLNDLKRLLSTLSSDSVGNRLAAIDTITTDRNTAKQYIIDFISVAEALLRSDSQNSDTVKSLEWAKILRRLLAAKRELDANVNPKLVVDSVFLPG